MTQIDLSTNESLKRHALFLTTGKMRYSDQPRASPPTWRLGKEHSVRHFCQTSDRSIEVHWVPLNDPVTSLDKPSAALLWLGTLSIHAMTPKVSSKEQIFLLMRSILSFLDLHLITEDCTLWLSVKITIRLPLIISANTSKAVTIARPSNSKMVVFWSALIRESNRRWSTLSMKQQMQAPAESNNAPPKPECPSGS